MSEQWYLRETHGSSVYGPYNRKQINEYVRRGSLAPHHQISKDKKHWAEFKTFVQMSPLKPRIHGGKILANYELREELGRGGMGIVYHAFDFKLQRECALKVLQTSEEKDERSLKRFIEEARAAASLKHPNIVNIYEVGTSPKFFFTMEYVQGVTLKEWINSDQGQLKDALNIFADICRGIAYAHENKIIHRDLKPENIMIDKDNAVKVMDFGLAKDLDSRRSLSCTGEIIGTPKYMSQEVADGSKGDIRSDIYSLGAILYEILTKRAPFEGSNAIEIFYQLANSEVIPPSRLNPSVPKDVEIVCLHCLKKSPDARYQSVAFLVEEIENIIANRPIKTQPPGMLERSFKWCQRYPLIALLLVLTIGLALLASFSYYLERTTRIQLWKSREEISRQNKDIRKQALELKEAKIAKEKALEESHRQLGEVHMKLADYQINNRNLSKAAQELLNAHKIFYGLPAGKTFARQKYLTQIAMLLQYSIFPNLPCLEKEITFPFGEGVQMAFAEKYIALRYNQQIFIWPLDQVTTNQKVSKTFDDAEVKIPCTTVSGPISISMDGNLLAITQREAVDIYDIHKRRNLYSIPLGVDCLSFGTSGHSLLLRNRRMIQLVDVDFNARQILKIDAPATPLHHWNISRPFVDFESKNSAIFWNTSWGIDKWDKNGKVTTVLKHLGGDITCVKSSPDKMWLAYGDRSGRLAFYSISDQNKIMLAAHRSSVNHIQFSPDGRLCASADSNGMVCLWHIARKKLIFKLPLGRLIWRLRFTPQGRYLETISFGVKKLHYQKWKIEPYLQKVLRLTPDERLIFKNMRKLTSHIDFLYEFPIAISPCGQFVAAPYHIYCVLWNINQNNTPIVGLKTVSLLEAHTAKMQDFSLSPDAKWIAILYRSRKLVIEKVNEGHVSASMNIYESISRSKFTFSNDSRFLLYSKGRVLKSFHIARRMVIRQAKSINPIRSIAVSPNGKWIALGQSDGMLEIWPQEFLYKEGREKAAPRGNEKFFAGKEYPPYTITDIAWHCSGEKLAVLNTKSQIVVWQRDQQETNHWEIINWWTFPEQVAQVSFAPDGHRLGIFTKNDIAIYDLRYKLQVYSYLGYLKGGAASFERNWNYLTLPAITGEILIFHLDSKRRLENLSPAELEKEVFIRMGESPNH